MYVGMYVCSRNTAKMVYDGAKILGPPYSPFSFRSNWGMKKNIKKSIPYSVKYWYSLEVFDQCKQPQWYSSLELSFF